MPHRSKSMQRAHRTECSVAWRASDLRACCFLCCCSFYVDFNREYVDPREALDSRKWAFTVEGAPLPDALSTKNMTSVWERTKKAVNDIVGVEGTTVGKWKNDNNDDMGTKKSAPCTRGTLDIYGLRCRYFPTTPNGGIILAELDTRQLDDQSGKEKGRARRHGDP